MTSNVHDELGADVELTPAPPVLLVRYRSGVVGETARTVHVVPLPIDRPVSVVSALCGTAVMLADMETVTPGEGMPCTLCVLHQTPRTTPPVQI